jgi:chlorobactene glucosyltransferase
LDLFLLGLPWIAIGVYLVVVFRDPPGLPPTGGISEGMPFVSVVVPARNEEVNIHACLSSLSAQDYPAFEVILVDDRSTDGTAEIAEALAAENPSLVTVLRGEPLPKGWFGKPWACWQGKEVAKGDLLLFTDADTTHESDLLDQAVHGFVEEEADVLTLLGGQIMGSFWERLIQPQFFMLLAGRFPRTGSSRKPHQWKHAIANGQYLLFSREVYDAVGGHRAVAGEVAEDLRLAQLLVRGGWRLVVRSGPGLQTRMYRSLKGLVEGWSKNVATAALQSTAPWLIPFILPLSFVVGVTLWILPPIVLLLALLLGKGGLLLLWSASVTGVSVLIWGRVSLMMRGSPFYGLLYPLGAMVGGYIFLRSWRRGARVEWKGRTYEVPEEVRKGSPQ